MVDPAAMMGMGGGMGMGAPAAPPDPLKLMQDSAKTNIEQIKKNSITTEKDLINFKKEVLTNLKEKIDKFTGIDQKAAAKKAEEEAKKAAEAADASAEPEEEDPFAGIFDDEEEGSAGGIGAEFTQEKMKLAAEFVEWVKIFRVKFLKDVRLNRESEQDVKEEQELSSILGQLDGM